MYDSILVLGFLASKSESASAFIRNGTDFDFWKNNRGWTGASDRYGGAERILVSDSILALGLSGNSEVPQLLYQLANKDAEYAYKVADSLASAAFYYDLSSKAGPQDMLKMQLSGDEVNVKYNEWIETTNGRQWRAWSSYVKGHT